MHKSLKLLSVSLSVVVFAATGRAANRDGVAEALQNNLIDRTFVTQGASSSRDASGEEHLSEVARRWTFANLSKSSKGLAFDAVVNIAQTDTFTSNSGDKTVRRRDRAMVVRFEAQELTSTGDVVGFARYVSYAGMEGKDPTGRGMSFAIKLQGDLMRMIYKDATPSETASGSGGTLQLIQCDHQDDFKLAGANTTRKFAQRCYKVDPATFARGEALTPYISEDTIQQ